MKKNKLTKIIAIPIAITLATSTALAQDTTINADLAAAASKVDIEGSYLLLNKVDGDIAHFTPYIQLIADAARANGENIPEEFNAVKLINALGLNKLKAFAVSNTNTGEIWLNQVYAQTDTNAGIFSILGAPGADFAVTKMSPLGTDIALELSLDLSKLPTIAKDLGESVGKKTFIEEKLAEKPPELGITTEEFLKKNNFKLNLAIDLDQEAKIDIKGKKFDRPRIIARIDGLTWLWDKVGDDLIKEMGMPLQKTEKGGIITYDVPNIVKEMIQGYTPQLIIDKDKDQIWLTSSPEFLTKATTTGQQLTDDPKFKATWQGLPAKGNSMAYISKDFLNTLEALYAKAQKEGLLEDEEFKKAQPIIDKLIKDITKSKNGFAFSIGNDGSGIHLANKTPFPAKYLKYLQTIAPILNSKKECGAKCTDVEDDKEIKDAKDATH